MKTIMDFLDKQGAIDDSAVAYNYDGPYPFTLQEFREFTDKVWADAGGWDESGQYFVEGALFETYHVPFQYEGKEYILNVMYGQGSAWTVFTKAEHDAYKKRIAEMDRRDKNEDAAMPDQHDA